MSHRLVLGVMMSLATSIMPHMKITISSHNFAVSRLSQRGREICFSFSKRFIAWGWETTGGRFTRVAVKTYATSVKDRSVFRFHINALDEFKQLLIDSSMIGSLVEWVDYVPYKPIEADFKVKPMWVARDYQEPVIEYLINPTPVSKLVELQTGFGKSAVALFSLAKLGKRIVVVLKPQYISKWMDDFQKTYEDIKDEIMVVRGSGHLMKLLDLAREDKLNSSVILISSTTLRNWISSYEELGEEILDMGYACTPYNLFEYLGAGVRLIDECHQDFHFYFKLDTYTNVPTSISLSATLLNDDAFITKMYGIMFPLNDRMRKLALDKYIDSFAVHFNFKSADHIRTEEYGSTMYSHMAVEKSIMRHVPTLLNYLRLIDYTLDIGYFKNKLPGDRAIIFAASIEMCTKITDYLKKHYPHLDIRRYVEDDPYANVIDADIRVTTIGSGGTAIDIDKLSCGIMTTAISSLQANIQALGRLRKRKEGKTEFYYFCADNIEKHCQYHAAKKEMLNQRARTFNEIYTGHQI